MLHAEIQRMVQLTSERQKREIKNEVEVLLRQRYYRKESQDVDRVSESKSKSQSISCDSYAEGSLRIPTFGLPHLNDTLLPALDFEGLSAAPVDSSRNDTAALECGNPLIFDRAYSQQDVESGLSSATFLESPLLQNLWDDLDANSSYQTNNSGNISSNTFRNSSILGGAKSSSMASQESQPFVSKVCRCRSHTLECNTAVEGGDESCRCCSGWFSWSKFAIHSSRE